jgi:hypothetical protein
MTTLTRNIAQMVTEVADHIAQDRVIQGIYYLKSGNSFKGCFIGCLSHSDDARKAVDRFGLTLPLLRIAENIFEALLEAEAKKFFSDFASAVGVDGKDLSNVHWQFLAAELKALPKVSTETQIVIDVVIDGMDRLAQGLTWPAAAAAARAAARAAAAAAARAAAYNDAVAADAAYDAAYAAARAAAYDAVAVAAYAVYAADAAYDAANDACRQRQRDTLLNLIRNAPVVEAGQ